MYGAHEVGYRPILAPEIQTPILQFPTRNDILYRRIANVADREKHRARRARGDGAEVLREGEHGPVRSPISQPCQLLDRRWKEGVIKKKNCMGPEEEKTTQDAGVQDRTEWGSRVAK